MVCHAPYALLATQRCAVINNSTSVALLQSPDGLDNWFASHLSSSVPPDLQSAFDMGGAPQFNLSNGMVKYAFDDRGSFINYPGHLLAFRHRSGSGT